MNIEDGPYRFPEDKPYRVYRRTKQGLMEDCRGPKPTLKTPRVQLALEQFDKLSPEGRAEILSIIKVGYALEASPAALAWWRNLPGQPDHKRFVLSTIKKTAKAAAS